MFELYSSNTVLVFPWNSQTVVFLAIVHILIFLAIVHILKVFKEHFLGRMRAKRKKDTKREREWETERERDKEKVKQ